MKLLLWSILFAFIISCGQSPSGNAGVIGGNSTDKLGSFLSYNKLQGLWVSDSGNSYYGYYGFYINENSIFFGYYDRSSRLFRKEWSGSFVIKENGILISGDSDVLKLDYTSDYIILYSNNGASNKYENIKTDYTIR